MVCSLKGPGHLRPGKVLAEPKGRNTLQGSSGWRDCAGDVVPAGRPICSHLQITFTARMSSLSVLPAGMGERR